MRPELRLRPSLAAVFDVSIEDIIGEQPVKIKAEVRHTHKNSRVAKLHDLYDKLTPTEQRVILKQVKTLARQA
jgi:hypothetical protein